MTTTQPLLNLNQFSQAPVLGSLALGLGSFPLVIQAVISVNQGATALVPGQAIKFDTTVTTNPTGLPPIVSCAATAQADGYVVYDVRQGGGLLTAQPSGNVVQILLQGVMWMLVEDTTIDSGNILQDATDAGSMEPYATQNYYPRGISLDYATAGQLFRAFLTPATIKAAATAAHA